MLPSISLLLKIDEREQICSFLMVGMCKRKEQERLYRFCGDARFRSEKRRCHKRAAAGHSIKTSELK